MKKIYIANWKMNKSFDEALTFSKHYKDDLHFLAVEENIELVICPDFTALASLKNIFEKSMVRIGAQTCSSHSSGSYTGQVSAASVAQVGAHYCLVGHSETRANLNQSIPDYAQQVAHLFAHDIHPVICIGEKTKTNKQETFKELEEQLAPFLETIKQANKEFSIAYEPTWAIGSGNVASSEHIKTIFQWLSNMLKSHKIASLYHLLYGGSVDEHNSNSLKQIKECSGFLIGSASLDFQKLQKIVS